MLRRSWTVCAMTALLLGGTAAAQSPGTVLVGGFGQYTLFDDNLNLENGFGFGGRAGGFIAPSIWLEAEGSYTQVEEDRRTPPALRDVKYGPISARIMFGFPIGRFGFSVGGGGVLSNYRSETAGFPNTYNYGVEGAAGIHFGFGTQANLRIQGLVDYMPNSEPDATTNFRFQAGVDFTPDIATMMGMVPTTAGGPVVWWDELDAPLPGTVELGGFGQWTWFDDHAGRCSVDPCVDAVAKDGFGYGGRVGVFLSDPRFQLEGDGYYSPQDRDPTEAFCCAGTQPSEVNASAFALRLNYNFPLGNLMGRQTQFIIGAGAVRTNYKFEGARVGGESHTYNYGASGLAGVRIGVVNRIALRLDGVIDYMPNHEPDANMNLHARAGLSFLLGGARPEAMCTYTGLESIPASSPNCVPPPPPPPLPPPPPPPPPVEVFVDTAAITAPIYFDFDKSDIRPDAAATLDRKVPWLNANPGMRIRIEGNADNRGSDEYNLALGQRRAASAKNYLVNRGIAAGRFDLVSYGEERPVCSQAPMTEECHQLNRRDDFRIITIGNGRIMVPPEE